MSFEKNCKFLRILFFLILISKKSAGLESRVGIKRPTQKKHLIKPRKTQIIVGFFLKEVSLPFKTDFSGLFVAL